MNRPRVKNLLLPSARNETVGWEVGVYLHRLSEVVKIREDVWVVVLPVPALARGHLGRYDMARGWWIHLAADESRPLVGAPVLGQRLVDPSILGALRHELGHHVYARSGQLRAQWHNLYCSFGLSAWFRSHVSLYAGTNSEEAWCECFSATFAGLNLPAGLHHRVRQLLGVEGF